MKGVANWPLPVTTASSSDCGGNGHVVAIVVVRCWSLWLGLGRRHAGLTENGWVVVVVMAAVVGGGCLPFT